jgi:cell wall-associated NlpC family hydrolase
VAAIAVVVVLIVAAVIVTVAASMRSGATVSQQEIVFTIPAPYHPNAVEPTGVAAPSATVVLPPEGNWTQQRGEQIAARALRWLNWPYSWDAGDANGPTYGVAVDASSRNDASVLGFDCSGLVIYALAPYLNVSHDASSQYTEAGTVHPALNALQPGDLVFWSKDGTIGGIGHVAIYVGNGEVVQAPHSGAYIDVVPLDQVESGRIGTTRPLT